MIQENQDVVRARVWVICPDCGSKHRVIPGIGAPVYWCGNTLRSLEDGDDVECEEKRLTFG